MRFAISAVAAISGIFLFGLAFYGQPALYLHQAREEWYALMDRPSADEPVDPDRDAAAERVARLQQQVAQLEDALAAHQNPVAQPLTPQPLAPQPATPQPLAPQPLTPQPATPQPEATQPRIQVEAGGLAIKSAPPQTSSPQSGPPQLAQLGPAPAQAVVAQPPTTAPPQLDPSPQLEPAPWPEAAAPRVEPAAPRLEVVPPKAQPEASRPAAVQPEAPASRVTAPAGEVAPPANSVPQRRGTAAAESKPQSQSPAAPQPAATPQPAAAPQIADPESSKPQSTRLEALKLEPSKPETAKPAAQKLASLKQPTPVPPLPQPLPRQDTDDAQSVLARLRQLAPPPAPAQQVNAPPPIELKSRPAQSPSVPRLTAARAALAAGRVEDARRVLQEVQLQLVFRPVSAAGDDLPLAGKGAADVAHALDALSANDIPLSRRYIDVAVDDLSGGGTNPPVQESQVRTTGYAPAYPPR